MLYLQSRQKGRLFAFVNRFLMMSRGAYESLHFISDLCCVHVLKTHSIYKVPEFSLNFRWFNLKYLNFGSNYVLSAILFYTSVSVDS
jgi:hypothetical protein